MLSCSIRNQMFTSRNLKKCALVCTTRVQQLLLSLCNFFRSCATIVLVSTGTQPFERALRWRENATIYKEQMQTKCSDVINFYSIVDKRRGSQRVQRDDEEQMAYICRYFCVRPLNNFSDELE